MRLFRYPGMILSILLLAVTALAVIAPALLAPYDPYESVGTMRLAPPSWEHLFGTDHLARDVFSRDCRCRRRVSRSSPASRSAP